MIVVALTACSTPETPAEPRATYRVKVVAEGQPVEGAEVSFEQVYLSGKIPRREQKTFSDGSGRADAAFPGRAFTRVSVQATGRAPTSAESLEPDEVREIELPPAYFEVRGAHGVSVFIAPASRTATVVVRDANNERLETRRWTYLIEERVGPIWFPLANRALEVGETTVALSGLEFDRTYRVTAWAPGLGCDWTILMARPAVTPGIDVELDLKSGRPFSGVVTDEQGSPIVEARLAVSSDLETPLARRTDAKGRFTLENVPRADTCVHVSAPGFEPRLVPVVEGATDVGTVVLTREPSK